MILRTCASAEELTELIVSGNRLILLPEKAVFWADASILFISDLHIGKVTHFRREGIAVPPAAFRANFTRLNQLVDTWKPAKIVFTGDLVHSLENREWQYFLQWREAHPKLSLHLVPGNHDRDILPFCHQACIVLESVELLLHPFTAIHAPRKSVDDEFLISGHIHPAVQISGLGQRLRFPCFYLEDGLLILPSFGEFTGSCYVDPAPENQVIAIVENRLLPLPGKLFPVAVNQ